MKCLLLTLSFLSLFSTAYAERMEHHVTIQMKLMDQQPNATKNGTTLFSYKTFAFKTSDFIEMMEEPLTKPFSSKARLLLVVTKTNSIDSSQFIIRDGGIDTEIPSSTFALTQQNHVNIAEISAVTKGKLGPTFLTGAEVGPAEFLLDPPGLPPVLKISGVYQKSYRVVLSKQFTSPPISLDLGGYSITGWGTHDLSIVDVPKRRVVQGSFKVSPAKMLKTLE